MGATVTFAGRGKGQVVRAEWMGQTFEAKSESRLGALVNVHEQVRTEVAGRAERPPCLCGCGGYPKGAKARFIPGHDAKYHSAQKKAQVQS